MTPAVLDPAVSAGLIGVDGAVVRFEHPLIRSSIYQRLGPATQRAGHDALARVLHGHPERAVWHRAAAALHPDSALAAELEQAADRALPRGATSNAVHALERAAKLSAEAGDGAGACSGPPPSPMRVAGRDRPTGCARATGNSSTTSRPAALRVALRAGQHRPRRRAPRRVLIELAEQAHAVDDDTLALQFLRAAALRCWNFCPDRPVGKEVIAAADRLAVADAPVRAALLAYGAPFESADDVLEIIAGVKAFERDATTTYQLGHAAACVGAFDVSETLFAEAVGRAARGGQAAHAGHRAGAALMVGAAPRPMVDRGVGGRGRRPAVRRDRPAVLARLRARRSRRRRRTTR